MAITSYGYPGSIDATTWASMTASFGADYGVVGAGDLKVSVVSAADRTVKIAAGSGYGRGIFDVSSAEETIQLEPILSGSRWDLVGFLRTWDGLDSATTVRWVLGTSSQTAAFASRATTPGSSDFQPLALVQVTAGSTVPTAVIDLRVWQANGGAVANDVLALQYLNGAGTEVWVGMALWHRYVDSSGALQWVSTGGDTGWSQVSVNTAGGISHYTTSPYNGLQIRRVGNMVTIGGPVVKAGGFSPGVLVATLAADMRPTVPVDLLSNSGSQLTLLPNGELRTGLSMPATISITTSTYPV